MKSLVICLVLLAVLIVPVSAGFTVTGGDTLNGQHIRQENLKSFTYTADSNQKIRQVEFEIPINTVVNFTLYYGTGSTVSGWVIYRVNTPLINSFTEVAIDTSVYSTVFIDPLISGLSTTRIVKFSGYARNDSATDDVGFAIYAQGYGLWNGEIAYYSVPDLPSNLIYRVDMVSTEPITILVNADDSAIVSAQAASTLGESIATQIGSIYDFGMMIVGVVFTLLYWLKFIFVDNLVLTVVMYFAGTLAIAMNTSGNFFKRLERFFRYQVKLFNFVSTAFKTLLDMIVSVKSLIPFLK